MILGLLQYFIIGLGLMGSTQRAPADIPLFQQYSLLQYSLPYVQLGQWPTPVHQLQKLGSQLGIPQLWIKREDRSGLLFGGNKVRKLEFVLADAIKQNKKSVICYGGVASNNVTATSVYAKQLGLECVAFLMDQLPAANLKRNLMLDYYYGCKFFLCPYNRELTTDELQKFLQEHKLQENPYIIPMGSSNKIGIIGWVNAVFELKNQIEQGIMREPDYIYVSYGSMGTVAGILLGIQACGLKTRVKPIQVTDPKKYTAEKLCVLIQQSNELLHEIDSAFPLFVWNANDIKIITDFFGYEFACHTPEADHAQKVLWDLEQIIVDESYTAKVIAGLLHDCKNGTIQPDDVVLYWHTYCAHDFTEIVTQVAMHQLPAEFQKYL